MNLCAKADLSKCFTQIRRQLEQTVQAEKAEYLLNVNEQEYYEHLINRFSIEPIKADFDNIFITAKEINVPASRHPRSHFVVEAGQTYKRQLITYHIPYRGTEDLLTYRPNPYILQTQEVELAGNCICFDIIDFFNDADEIRRKAESIKDFITRQLAYVNNNVQDFNASLSREVKTIITRRRQQLIDQDTVVKNLGVPIKRSTNVPDTFSVPSVRKKVIQRPSVKSSASEPEPTIDQQIYDDILQTIHDMGKVFERHPNTYRDKDEEALRDHLILQLEPRFEGSTTGETFNKSGKTDILIRHEKKNVFVAECKFWSGESGHLETIDQLLSYLTWRDSKTAIVYFVTRKDFTSVLNKIVACSKKHKCHVRHVGTREESWYSFEFHLPGDLDRKVYVAILAFHLPKAA